MKNSVKKLNEKGILKVTPSRLELIVIVHGLKEGREPVRGMRNEEL
jgi:hypothetical protein